MQRSRDQPQLQHHATGSLRLSAADDFDDNSDVDIPAESSSQVTLWGSECGRLQ